jgi:hypothetical protein
MKRVLDRCATAHVRRVNAARISSLKGFAFYQSGRHEGSLQLPMVERTKNAMLHGTFSVLEAVLLE